VSQLEYLEKAVGIVLAVIAVKMTGETFDIEVLSPLQSLILVLAILAGGVGLSLAKNNKTE
jgi:predicted tellurium resistance membrane protein TerC